MAVVRSLLILGGLALTGLWASAQKASPVLHQDLPAPNPGSASGQSAGAGVQTLGPKPSPGQNPTAIASQDRLLPKPNPLAQKEEPVWGTSGFAVDRQTSATPDRFTGADNELNYVEIFNPSVVPF